MSPTTGHDTIGRLTPAVCDAPREIGTLTPTGLMHEAYLRHWNKAGLLLRRTLE